MSRYDGVRVDVGEVRVRVMVTLGSLVVPLDGRAVDGAEHSRREEPREDLCIRRNDGEISPRSSRDLVSAWEEGRR